MECLHCHKEFTPQKASAMYCSASCRTKAFNLRKASAPGKPVVHQPAFNMSLMGLGDASGAMGYLLQKAESENIALKGDVKRLTEKVEALKEENSELKLEKATAGKLAEAEALVKDNQGLGGFADKIIGNDRVMDMLENLGLAWIGKTKGDDDDPTDMLDGVEENRMLLETVLALIREQNEEFLAHYIKATQFFVKNPQLLKTMASNPNLNQKTA